MRVILFRGKTKGNVNTKDDVWVYGLPFYNENGQIDGIESQDGKLYYVRPETVGQYTDLTDKNGKKNFEGDIIKQQTFHKLTFKYANEKEKKEHKRHLIKKCGAIFDSEETYHKDYIYEVKFENARFYPFADDDFEWGSFDCDTPFEVIGNIHDNPELLKGEDEE